MKRAGGALLAAMTVAIAPGCSSTNLRVAPETPAAAIRALPAGAPLLVWDGMLLRGFTLRSEDTAAFNIARVTAIDPAEAERRWGERGARGAVVVTTANGSGARRLADRIPHIERLVEHFDSRDPAPTSQAIMLPPPGPGPMYIVDGSIVPTATLLPDHGDIVPDTIEIVRGLVARRMYGTRAWGGVVRVTSK
jgi:hypothetical protein